MALATDGRPDTPALTNAGKAATRHLERAAAALSDAKPG